MLSTYPLARARCIHVSGGKWSEAGDFGIGRRFRRDTHDHGVLAPVLDLLRDALGRCPSLQVVIVERLGPTLSTAADQAELRADVAAVAEILATAEAADG